MNSRFLLPASVAGAMHLAVLLFPSATPVLRPPVAPAHPVAPPDPAIAMIPETAETPDPSDADSRPRGTTTAHPPVGEEPPPTEHPDPNLWPEPITPVNPSGNVTQTLAPGSWGFQDGVEGAVPHAGTDIVDASHLDRAPQTRSQIAPVYPQSAAAEGCDGEVWVRFLVDESGAVRDAEVVRSSDRRFDEPTLRAVTRWRFEPGRKNGRVVRFRMAVPVVFHRTD